MAKAPNDTNDRLTIEIKAHKNARILVKSFTSTLTNTVKLLQAIEREKAQAKRAKIKWCVVGAGMTQACGKRGSVLTVTIQGYPP